jgi:threonine synthase
MKYFSTKGKVGSVSFEKAIKKGLPADNGLFFPESIPKMGADFLQTFYDMPLAEIAFQVVSPFVGGEIEEKVLRHIVGETLTFPLPVVHVHNKVYSLELYHGPTCAFKDVGARFLARCLGHFSKETVQAVKVLVATSGDTGSAVANGFLNVPNVEVVILYPKGKVSHLQEQQLTTLGNNITALEVAGTFDDCQKLVKEAFLDEELNREMQLTSANSINIARLLPQSFYYWWALTQVEKGKEVVFSVPSGNYGNLTAGLLAKAMGAPISKFVAVSNANDIVPVYLDTKQFYPKPSVQTISNAMDVGNPSNFSRMEAIYGQEWEGMVKDVVGFSISDEETKETLAEVFEKYQYQLDPHGAVGYLGLQKALGEQQLGIFLETAHPAKFKEVVEAITGKVAIPERLAQFLEKEKKAIPMEVDYNSFKSFLKTK